MSWDRSEQGTSLTSLGILLCTKPDTISSRHDYLLRGTWSAPEDCCSCHPRHCRPHCHSHLGCTQNTATIFFQVSRGGVSDALGAEWAVAWTSLPCGVTLGWPALSIRANRRGNGSDSTSSTRRIPSTRYRHSGMPYPLNLLVCLCLSAG